jgi:hypothetical protein
MQKLLQETITVASQTENKTVINALCAHVINIHNTLTWPEVCKATTHLLLEQLPATDHFTTEMLASYVTVIARAIPVVAEKVTEIDLAQRRRQRHEEDDSDSSSFESKQKTTKRRRKNVSK